MWKVTAMLNFTCQFICMSLFEISIYQTFESKMFSLNFVKNKIYR